ncbi:MULTISPECIES: DUF2946 family protein [unclassified Mesorhizobium]|uniref:DUF2946 family protein n=1 Tax=unclassified Mesorhizobium TaxID=325217 RepID=UPI00333B8928
MPVAFAAAWLLVLQSMLGAFASGIEPNASQFDAFGNTICTHDGATQLPAGDPHPQHMPACCMLGCNLVSAVYAPPPDAGGPARSLSVETVAFILAAFRHRDFARARTPSNPRAPPATA